jgi:hypothetical protein
MHLTEQLQGVGGRVDLASPVRPSSCYAVNIEIPHSFAQMNVWPSGQVDIIVLDATSGMEAVNRTVTVESEAALQDELEALLAVLRSREGL